MNPSATSGSTPRLQRDAGQDQNIQSQTTDPRRAGDAGASSSVAAGQVEPARADKPKDLAVPSGLHSGEASSSSGLKMSQDAVKMPTVEGGERLPVVPTSPDTGESSLETRLSGIQIRDPEQERVVAEKKTMDEKLIDITKALKRIRFYTMLKEPLLSGNLDEHKKTTLSNTAFTSLPIIQQAIETSQTLPTEYRQIDTEIYLNKNLHMSAYDALVYFQFNADYFKSEFPTQPEQLAQWRNNKLKHVGEIESTLGKIRTADQALPRQTDVQREISLAEVQLAMVGHNDALKLQAAYLQLKLSEMAWLVNSFQVPEVGAVVGELIDYMDTIDDRYGNSYLAVVDGKGKEEDFQNMAKASAKYIQFGEPFCQAAAGTTGPDQPILFQHSKDIAKALSEYAAHIQNVIDEKYVPDEWLPPEMRKSRAADADKASEPAKPAGKSKKKSRSKPAKGKAASSSNPPQDSKSDYRNMLTKEIDKHLNKWRTVPAGAGDDPVAVARAMGKETGKVDTLQGEPSDVYKLKSFRTDQWFGNLHQLKDMKQKLLDLPQPHETERLAELDRCIERRERMERVLERQQVDGFKTYEFPRAIHLKTLLERGQVDPSGVSKPVRLTSEGDDGDKGTLFEVRIRPKPLSNGQPSSPLYLHLHTDRPVSAGDLDRIEPNRFTAIHLKNETQRGLGRRWEQLTGQLGEVHRGKVGPEMARELLTLAR